MRSLTRLRTSLAGVNVRRSLLVIAICGILIADVATGGGLQRRVHMMKKYGQVAMIALIGLGVLLLVNKPGADNMSMVSTATGVISSMPSSATTQLIQSGLGLMGGGAGGLGARSIGVVGGGAGSSGVDWGMQEGSGESGGVPGGGSVSKRSVSDARRRAVAASQGWQCGHCGETLEATYEVDHIVELQDGGTNDVNNLMALCRNCHGRKTLEQRLRRQ